MKILLTGSQGQVGQSVLACAPAYAVNIIAVSRTTCNIADKQAVFHALAVHQPDVVINAAAYTAVDAAEDHADLARAANAAGSLYLAKACRHYGIPLLHISTDYVFDGCASSPYTEEDAPNPMSVYGKTKYEGEEHIRSVLPEHIILRTSWVFSPYAHNFVKTMLRLFDERETISVVNDQFGGPTSADAIARALLVMAKAVIQPHFSDWGVYHFSGAPAVTWWGFAHTIMDFYHAEKKKIQHIQAIASDQFPMKAKRPMYSVLGMHKIQRVFGISACDWRLELATWLICSGREWRGIRLLEKEIGTIQKMFRKHFGEHDHLWLFGSRVRKESRGGDIDLYVETYLPVSGAVKRKLAFVGDLWRLLGEQKIDVVLNVLPDSSILPIYEVARETGVQFL